jgi:DNA invertase Pin-like site-specific DNA recombinase
MANIGYIRVSTVGQNTDRQLDGVVLDKIFTEKQSGKSASDRQVLQECIEWIRDGDILHVHSIDRLARNLADLQDLINRINSKGVAIMFHKENLTFTADSTNSMSQLMLQLMGAFAEFERNIIKERQAEGIKQALSKGIKFGAEAKFNAPQIAEIKAKRERGDSVIELAKAYAVSRPTIYAVLNK